MIQWLLQSVQDIDVSPELFLSATEQAKFDAFQFPKRRSDWLIGRWTAKQLLQAVLQPQRHEMVASSALEIFNSENGAPYVRFHAQILPLHLTISHSHGCALCAVDTDPIGADLEWIEPRERSFINDYFTAQEQAHVEAAPHARRDTLVTGYWSAKEAVLKALHAGLSIDTRAIEISGAPSEIRSDCWVPYGIAMKLENSVPIRGWWRVQGGLMLTLATTSNDTPAKFPTSPDFSMLTLGAEHGKGHGGLPRRIAHSTRHHPRYPQGN